MENQIQNKKVETYAEDMAKAIEGGEGGIIKKIIHEQERAEEEKRNLSPESEKNRVFLILSSILLLVSVGVIAFIVLNRQPSTLPIAQQFTPIIFTDKVSFLDITDLSKEQVVQSLRNKVISTEVKPGGIDSIYIIENKKILGLRKFFRLVEAKLDQTKIAFLDDNFLIGSFNNAKSAGVDGNFFMLLNTRSVADVFEAIHTWEHKMFADLHGFFGIALSSDNKYLLTKDFEDGFIANKNARILYDNNKNIVMMYVLYDDSFIILTNTKEAINEVMVRLSASQVKK